MKLTKKFKPSGIIFDYDGTLADTPEDNFLAWQWALRQFHVEITRQDYFPLEGLKITRIAEKFLQIAKANALDIAAIVELREEYSRKNLTPKLYSSTLPTLRALQARGFPMALASAASRERLSHPALAELKSLLTVVLSGDDFKVGKPSPEPYLTAASLLKIPATECLVIENAPLGIQSARAAGMECIALRTTLNDSYLDGASVIVTALEDILAHIEG